MMGDSDTFGHRGLVNGWWFMGGVSIGGVGFGVSVTVGLC
jgi:hypothetical protein